MAENRRKYLKFIWKIENFSYIWNKKGDSLTSPNFYLDVFGVSKWCLLLYPRGRSSYEDYVGVFLKRLSSIRGPLEITTDYEIALVKANGETEYAREMKNCFFLMGEKYGFDNLVYRERLLGARKSVLLPEDVLTLQCCIFPKDVELQTYTEVMAKTYLKIEHYRCQLELNDYRLGDHRILLNGESNEERRLFQVSMFREFDNKPDMLTGRFYDAAYLRAFHCKIDILDSNSSISKVLMINFLDTVRETNSLIFPIIAESELLQNKNLFLPNGKLRLDCEFKICYRLPLSCIEGIARNTSFTSVPVNKRPSTSEIDSPSKKFLFCIDSISSSLKNDFQNLYQEGTVSDFTINVGDKDMKVHKAVLCARSPVFKAMLTSNMKEKEKNRVDISDFEEDTVHRMLKFMYTDIAGNLDWETAIKLYPAADKYSIMTLKSICSEVLKQNLSIANVGQVLSLADMHTDEYLKEMAVEFIYDHESEVMRSTEWKTFMAENLNLAADIMFQIFLKKAENRH